MPLDNYRESRHWHLDNPARDNHDLQRHKAHSRKPLKKERYESITSPNQGRVMIGRLRNTRLSSYHGLDTKKPSTASVMELTVTSTSRPTTQTAFSLPKLYAYSTLTESIIGLPEFLHRPFTTNEPLWRTAQMESSVTRLFSRGKPATTGASFIEEANAGPHGNMSQRPVHSGIPLHFQPAFSLDSFSDPHPGTPRSEEQAIKTTKQISQGLVKPGVTSGKEENVLLHETHHHKRFIMSMGKIIRDNPAFAYFCTKLKDASSELVLQHILAKIDAFGARYSVIWAEFSFQKIFDFVSKQAWRLSYVNDSTIISFTVNPEEVQKFRQRPGQRYRGLMPKEAAAIKIQSTWRMIIRKRIFIEHMEKVRAVRSFWGRWNLRKQMGEIRKRRQQSFLDMLDVHEELNRLFFEDWASHFANQTRTIIHIPSMSFPEQYKVRMESMETWQTRQFSRLLDLLDPNVTVVYITLATNSEFDKFLKHTLSQMFDYQDLIRSKRLIIFPIKRPACFASSVSLTTILLSNYNALRRLSSFIKTSNAYIVPAFVGSPEVELSVTLGIPILGSYQACTEMLCSKSVQRKFLVNNGILVPPGFDSFENELDMYHKLESLIKQYPQYPRWVFKMNQEPDARGFAYIDVDSLKDNSAAQSTLSLHIENEEPGNDSDDEGDTLKRMRAEQQSRVSRASRHDEEGDEFDGLNGSKHPFREKFSVWVCYAKRDLWRNWKHFVRAFLRRGGVLEAVLHPEEKAILEYPVVHMILEPGIEEARILGSGNQVCTDLFQVAGCIFPQFRYDYTVLSSGARKIAREFTKREIYGHISCEFVAFKPAGNEEYEFYCTSVKPYFNENLAQCYSALFFSKCQSAFPDGRFYYNLNIGKKLNLRYLQKATYFDMTRIRHEAGLLDAEADNEERCVFYITKLSHQNFELTDAKLFQSLCIDRGISYSDKWRTGTIIPMFETYKNTGVSLILVGKSTLEVVEQFLINLLVIGRIIGGNVAVPTNFLEIATYFCKLIGILKPNYVHQPSVTKGIGRLTDLERLLNRYITLPIQELQNMIAAEERELAKAKKGPSMSTTTIQLLNAGVPSKSLNQFYADFGREKLDGENPRHRLPGRIPPGLPLSDYMIVMEQLAGEEPKKLTEEQLKMILEGGEWADETAILKNKIIGAGQNVSSSFNNLARSSITMLKEAT